MNIIKILYNIYIDLNEPKLKQLNPLDFRLYLLNIKDIEAKKCQWNTVKENANIIRDPLQPDIISAFGINKNKKNKLDSDNTNLKFQYLFKRNVIFVGS